MQLRRLWLESRHLDAGAPGLRAALAALDEPARAEILAAGDGLAAVSLTLAQQFCRQAPAAWAAGAAFFRRWLASGAALTAEPLAARDAAAAYFTVPVADLAALPAGDFEAWIAAARRVLGASRRFGELFVAGSGAVLAELDRRALRLATWADAGLALFAPGGWDAELLALHFFEATELMLPLLAPADVPAWAAVAAAAERVPAARTELFASAPRDAHVLAEAERGAVARVAASAAATAPAVGLELWFSLPAVLAPFPEERAALLASLAPVAAAAPGTLLEVLPVLRALLEETPAADRRALVALAGTIAARLPIGVAPFYRVLPRLVERASLDGIAEWVRHGLALAEGRDEADLGARAYFQLDTRTSRAVLASTSTAVEFPEVEGLLKRYLHMLSGRAWPVAAEGGVGYRPPLGSADGDGPALFPSRVDAFPTTEANLRLYRLIAAQHAGRRAHGSHDLAPSAAEFFAGFEHPGLAEELYGIVDGVRVDAAVARTYRGLAADLRALAGDLARAPLPLPGTFPHLASVLRQSGRLDLVRALPAIAEGLAAPEATAATSAEAARILYAALVRDPRVADREALAASLADVFGADADDPRFALEPGGELPGAGGPGPEAGDDAPPPIDEPIGEIVLAPEEDDRPPGAPIDPRELLALLQAGADVRAKQGGADDLDALGLYISDLAGKLPRERVAELQSALRHLRGAERAGAPLPGRETGVFVYDEWDHRIADYRHAWCRLAEIALESDTGDFFHQTLATYADLLPEVRRQFQRIRPERTRVVHGLEDGEEVDLDAVVVARADRRAGQAPSPKLYQARQREERDVATLFLLDMSASTDEPVPDGADGRRVIDVIKEALVVMSEALEEIGDAYGIYGFSGHGRAQVEYYLVKHFTEPLSPVVRGRVGAIAPRRSTRMGAALRHAVAKIRTVAARSKHVLLLSDGFPQDLDYGDDRRSNVYGIQDTMMAFQEAQRAGVTPFCITVDKAGHDYLKEICDPGRYLIIDDIAALPRELPKIYQRFVRT